MLELLDFVHLHFDREWGDHATETLTAWTARRYGARWDKRMQLRVNSNPAEDAAPYAALIPAGQPTSGRYGGMSLVFFPSPSAAALLTLVIGTNGLAPDEQALGRPGHARKVAAISRWLGAKAGNGLAWAKHDPVRTDLGVPRQIGEQLEPYRAAAEKYDKLIYGLFMPSELRDADHDETVTLAVTAYADLFAEEHGVEPLKAYVEERNHSREEWLSCALPRTTVDDVVALLRRRRFAILEGPPGTGKTRLAEQLRGKHFPRWKTIQFHPSMTYELFVGGLAPEKSSEGLGLLFSARRGALMDAAAQALARPEPFLLHIDEINRADLAKVLGEAIYLFEPASPEREVDLPYDFGAPFGRKLRLPQNLFVLGTMNSADRSIAILDIAVRRRFAFLPVWPDSQVLDEQAASPRAREAFGRLLAIFLDEASDDAFALMPGHAYFLDGGNDPDTVLRTGLKPLLQEYLIQGYVSGFADAIRAYLDWLDTGSP